MRCAIIGFVAGVFALECCGSLPDYAVLGAVAAGAIALLLLLVLLGRRSPACNAIAGAMLGLCWAGLLAHASLAPQLAKDDEGRELTVVGTIDSLPYQFEQGVRFQFAIERVLKGASGAVPPRVALSWYAGFGDRSGNPGNPGKPGVAGAPAEPGRSGKPGQPVKPAEPAPAVQPGERWQLTVRLQRPHGSANPHGFDYEVWLLEQGVRATGYVRADAVDNRRLASFVPSAGNLVERCRAVLRARIVAALAGRPYAGVIVALVVGDQRAIEQDDWQVFSRTGVSHLISISGLHITMVAGMVASLASALWRRSFFTNAQLPLLLPAQKVAALAGAATALLYVLLAGFGVPAQRTLYMLTVVALALWTGRLTSISHVLCAALGVVVLLDPWAVLAPGFWLSFGAVGLMLYAGAGRTVRRRARARDAGAAPPRSDRAGPLAGSLAGSLAGPLTGPLARLFAAVETPLLAALRTQYVVTVGLVPLTLLLFSQVSLVSPVANAVAIPVISLVVTPLALVGSVLPAPLAHGVLLAAHACVELLAGLLAWLAGGALAVWSAPAPSPPLFAFAVLGTVWLLAPRGWPLRWLGLVAWLPALTAAPGAPPPGTFHATVFDVGQGMAVLIETAGHRLLYDAGPRYSSDGNGGNRVIIPYLKGRGIDRLDAMVISHSDVDHVGGALAVLEAVPVGQLMSSLDERHPLVRAVTAGAGTASTSRCSIPALPAILTPASNPMRAAAPCALRRPRAACWRRATSRRPRRRSCSPMAHRCSLPTSCWRPITAVAPRRVWRFSKRCDRPWRCFRSVIATAIAIRSRRCGSVMAPPASRACAPTKRAPSRCTLAASSPMTATAPATRATGTAAERAGPVPSEHRPQADFGRLVEVRIPVAGLPAQQVEGIADAANAEPKAEKRFDRRRQGVAVPQVDMVATGGRLAAAAPVVGKINDAGLAGDAILPVGAGHPQRHGSAAKWLPLEPGGQLERAQAGAPAIDDSGGARVGLHVDATGMQRHAELDGALVRVFQFALARQHDALFDDIGGPALARGMALGIATPHGGELWLHGAGGADDGPRYRLLRWLRRWLRCRRRCRCRC